jgi:hypothetical protein
MNLLLTPKDRYYPVTVPLAIVSIRFWADNLKSIHIKPSVATLMHNHERFIGQAIESVLAQKVNFK